MRTNDDVGALAHLGGVLALLAHVGRDLDDDLDAVLLAERVCVLLDDRGRSLSAQITRSAMASRTGGAVVDGALAALADGLTVGV